MSTESHNSTNQDRSYERISPTAWYVAYFRTLSDIPFSQEIFLELQDIIKRTRSADESERFENNMKLSRTIPMSFSIFTPYFEARFKIVSHLLKAHGINQILEIAAGFSGRGLEMARYSSVEYVEFDLPGVIQEKKAIVKKLIAKSLVSNHPNLHFEYGNALSPQDSQSYTFF